MAFLLEITSYSLGWSIIIITIILRLILLYPQHKMMVSQKKLQLIQPKIKDLQEKYK
jgi:YidC/Oxa1 family membrane protein insertase